MTTAPTRSTGRRRNPTTRAAILATAFDVVAELGYAGLTIEKVAARAGVGKQTIYRWWPGKGALVLDAVLERTTGAGAEAAELPDTGDLEADLADVLVATVRELTDPAFDRALRGLTAAIVEDAELARLYQERLDGPMRELKKRRLRSAQEAGQLDPGVDLDVAVDLIFAPVAQRWSERSGPLTPEVARAVVRHALRGLALPDPPR
ncbi:TetR/AcrR family transcriptional regulator [Promicromonospora citrea]|uniref:TetR family transcriptional regulator n=1 Tax=Promicromonospora citrea TaxID=43677 RepID=A0A8H9L0D9_9MICO|nr:TetR/AcrR family transcriptional regulator [Promicromonospora citrea]NNH54625.1 TetR/AcrR family transcriptional regulator [Promicromonospora citrea]GGM08666.1 TetR family transcriptional regulator [Promicromonospora citrea]